MISEELGEDDDTTAEAEEYRMFRVSFPDYFAPRCGLEFDASPADLRQWREEINRFLNAREQDR